MIEYNHWVVEVNGHVMIWEGQFPDNESMEVSDELSVELLFGPVPETLANAFFADWWEDVKICQNIGDVYQYSPLSGQHIFVVIGGKTLDVFSMLSFKERPNLIALSCYNIGLEGTFYITKRAYGCFLRRVQTEKDQWADRHPRLRRAMQWVAVLSEGEASSTHEHVMWAQNFGCEAANHYGGCMKVAHDAWKLRHLVPKSLKSRQNRMREFITNLSDGFAIKPVAFDFTDDNWIHVTYSDGHVNWMTVENIEYRMKKDAGHAE